MASSVADLSLNASQSSGEENTEAWRFPEGFTEVTEITDRVTETFTDGFTDLTEAFTDFTETLTGLTETFTDTPETFTHKDIMNASGASINVMDFSDALFNFSTATNVSTAFPGPSNTRMWVYIFLGLSIVLMNTFVLVVIYHFTWMRTNANRIIASMAVTDLIAGIMALVVGTIKWGQLVEVGRWFCFAFNLTDLTVAHASLYHVLAVNAERYFAIIKPLTYKKLFTRRLVYIYVSVIWVASAGLACLYIFHNFMNYLPYCLADVPRPSNAIWKLITLILTFPIPLLILILIYIHIVVVILQHLKFLQKHSNCSSNPGGSKGKIKRMIKGVGVIFIMYIICWGPTFMVLIVMNVSMLLGHELDTSHLLDTFHNVEVLAYANSFVNPIVYFLASQKFRKAAKSMFGMKVVTITPALNRRQTDSNSSIVNTRTETTSF